MILVTGSTGKIGTALIGQLQAQRIPFRALAHTPASYARLRAQQVQAVLADDLAAAFDDITQLFLLLPNSLEQAAIERQLIEAAQRAQVKHVVKLSVLGVEDPSVSLFRAHLESEQYLRQSGLGYTLLRPNLFMQNFGTIDAASIKQQSAIFNSAGDGVMSFVDTRDIAAVAVAVLLSEQHSGQTYTITGQAVYSYADIAQKMTALLGHAVQYVALSDDAYRAALLSVGLPDWYAEGLVELYRFYRAGKGAQVTNVVEQLTRRPAGTLDTYLADHRSLFE